MSHLGRPCYCTSPQALYVATIVALIVGGQSAQAVLVGIEYYDRAVVDPEFAGGPLWTGFVDTQANSVTIETWTELPLHGSEYWVPQNLPGSPLIWPARSSSGDLFDVPDSFDGHIDNTWGFVSDTTLQGMQWLRPELNNSTDPPTLDFAPAVFNLDTGDVWPGWGAFALQRNIGGQIVKVFETKNPSTLSGQPAFDERIMPALPVQPNLENLPQWIASTDATVTSTPNAYTTAVPEPTQWLALLLALAGIVSFQWIKRHFPKSLKPELIMGRNAN